LLHPWPFNIRELRQCLSRVTALVRDERCVSLADLPGAVASASFAPPEADEGFGADTGEPLPKSQLEALLTQHRGNVAEVARAMGKARMHVYRWMRRHGLDPTRFRT
jgi:transcriptional regulator of acetoin/glycerol metabolism